MNTDIFHSRFMRDYISSLHQVLIKNEIITNPKVLKCGQYLSREKGYIRYRIQCDKVKLCPRCKYRSAPERIQKMMSPGWLGQTAASLCWILSVFAYGISTTGDWLQLCAASSWMVSNIAAIVTLE